MTEGHVQRQKTIWRPPGVGPGIGEGAARNVSLLRAVAALTLAAVAVVMLALPGRASASWTAEQGPFPVGNLLSYANSDFEGQAGFVPLHNASISDADTGFLHSDSLQDTVGHAGKSSFGLPKSVAVGISGGHTYTISAYVKLSSASRGQAMKFALACYASPGRWLGWSYTPTITLVGERSWQYVEGQTTVPPECADAVGSPQVALSGMTAGEVVNVDEMTLRPYRAALVMGAHGNTARDGDLYSYTAADWLHTDKLLGPLQSDKFFYNASTSLPSTWANPANNCYKIEQALPSASWPECVIAYKVRQSEAQIQSFLAGLPADQQVMMVWWQEPENDTFSGCPGAASGNGPNFVCYFQQQSAEIRRAAAADGVTPQVLVAMDAETYAYHPLSDTEHNKSLKRARGKAARNGTSCLFIPPSSYVDVYLGDHYAYNVTSDLDAGPGAQTDDWRDWLACVLPQNKPIGVAEYGVNPNDSNPTGTASAITAAASYLAALPTTTHEEMAMWELWDSAPGVGNNWAIDHEPGAVSAWRSAETQNGAASNVPVSSSVSRDHHGLDRNKRRSVVGRASGPPAYQHSPRRTPPWWLTNKFTF
jgi:hypothetical protein